jgi:hypothetical protein
MKYALPTLVLCLCGTACSSAPTPAQRTAAWFKLRDVTRAECVIGKNDPMMPAEIRTWCDRVVLP